MTTEKSKGFFVFRMERDMSMVIVETELTTGELLALVQQLDTKEQIEFVQSIMANWEHQEDFDKVKKWIEQP